MRVRDVIVHHPRRPPIFRGPRQRSPYLAKLIRGPGWYIVKKRDGEDLGEGPWSRRSDAREFLLSEVGFPESYLLVHMSWQDSPKPKLTPARPGPITVFDATRTAPGYRRIELPSRGIDRISYRGRNGWIGRDERGWWFAGPIGAFRTSRVNRHGERYPSKNAAAAEFMSAVAMHEELGL